MSNEKERLRKLVEQQKAKTHQDPEKDDPDPGVDYAELYRQQTGKDLMTSKVLQ